MKILLVVVAALALAQGSLVSYIKNVQSHHSFQHLTTEEKLIFSELIVAAETDTLKAFVDRVGYVKIMTLLKDMGHEDAKKLSAYLAEHLGYHDHASGNEGILHKRDNSGEDSGEDSGNDSSDDDTHRIRLSGADASIYSGLLKASRSNMLTEHMQSVDAGALFGLLEKLDAAEADKLIKDMLNKLNTVEKRDDDDDSGDDDDDSDDSDDDDDDDDNKSRLSGADARVYSGLLKASRNNMLTDYMQSVDAGAVFGLLEKLDAAEADKLIKDMLNNLNTVEKRDDDESGDDDDDSDDSDDDDDNKSRLSGADARVYSGLLKASRNNMLTDYMQSVDAGAVFGLLEKLDAAEADKLIQDMLNKLNTVEKRDDDDSGDDDDDSDDSDDDDDDDNKSRLSGADARVYSGLLKASRNNMLTDYMQSVDAGAVFGLLEKLDAAEADKLIQEMLNKLNTVEKRDDDDSGDDDDDSDDSDDDDDDDDNKSRLSGADARVYSGLLKASRNNMLTDYMQSVDAGAVFGLLEKLDAAEADKLIQDMLNKLNTVEKRDDDDSGDDDDDSGDDDDDNSRLSDADRKVYKGLHKASRNNMLTDYMQSADVGAIFGLLEKLDADEADKLIKDMLSSLE